jgi:hypothetical protein
VTSTAAARRLYGCGAPIVAYRDAPLTIVEVILPIFGLLALRRAELFVRGWLRMITE